jgi:hypothetical protein
VHGLGVVEDPLRLDLPRLGASNRSMLVSSSAVHPLAYCASTDTRSCSSR